MAKLDDGAHDDTVRATAQMTAQMRKQMQEMKAHPERELGISQDELDRRKAEAKKPVHFTSKETNRSFEMRSSARAWRVMTEGLAYKQRKTRLTEMRHHMKVLRCFQAGLIAVSTLAFMYFGVVYILPHYAAMQERKRVMQIRYERAQASMQARQLAQAAAADGAAGAKQPPVIQ